MSDHILLHLPLLLSSVNSQDWLVAVVPSGGGRGRGGATSYFYSGLETRLATPLIGMCIQSHKLSGLQQAFLNNISHTFIFIFKIFSQQKGFDQTSDPPRSVSLPCYLLVRVKSEPSPSTLAGLSLCKVESISQVEEISSDSKIVSTLAPTAHWAPS